MTPNEGQIKRVELGLPAKAFRGELVPQDPNDEPAAVLLERIRAAREAAPAKSRQRNGVCPPHNDPLSLFIISRVLVQRLRPETIPGLPPQKNPDLGVFRR
jgi:hypothetical protein